MTTFSAPFAAQNLADFEAAVNATLAAQVVAFPGFLYLDIDLWVDQRRNGFDLRGILTLGEPALEHIVTPFVLKTFFGINLDDVHDAVQAFRVANPTYFISGVRILFADVGHREPQYVAWLIYNSNALAANNFTPK